MKYQQNNPLTIFSPTLHACCPILFSWAKLFGLSTFHHFNDVTRGRWISFRYSTHLFAIFFLLMFHKKWAHDVLFKMTITNSLAQTSNAKLWKIRPSCTTQSYQIILKSPKFIQNSLGRLLHIGRSDSWECEILVGHI